MWLAKFAICAASLFIMFTRDVQRKLQKMRSMWGTDQMTLAPLYYEGLYILRMDIVLSDNKVQTNMTYFDCML